jgi:alkylated DNA repair dioxygenase AlkB
MTATTVLGEETFKKAIEALDFEAIARRFREQDELIFVERFLPLEVVDAMVKEAEALLPEVHRSWMPFFRKGGAIAQQTIAKRAPLAHGLARSPAMLDFVTRLTGRVLEHKSDDDPHAHALYYYQRKGDYIAWHKDACGCDETASYTATLGMTNNTQSRVLYRLHEDQKDRPAEELALSMTPGSLVFFCGSKPNHCVTPFAKGEDRITFSFTFVEQGRRGKGAPRMLQNVVDAFGYFGLSALFTKSG